MSMYAGIGSRETPYNIIELMADLGEELAKIGWVLSTGGAGGADQAFADGANRVAGKMNLWIPWRTFNREWYTTMENADIFIYDRLPAELKAEAAATVRKYHPAVNRLSPAAWKLHGRNHLILKDTTWVIAWTVGGSDKGGTGQALREARDLGIKITNLGIPDDLAKAKAWLEKVRS